MIGYVRSHRDLFIEIISNLIHLFLKISIKFHRSINLQQSFLMAESCSGVRIGLTKPLLAVSNSSEAYD